MNPAKQNMIRIAVSMKVEVFVGLSSVRSDLVEGKRSTAKNWVVLLVFTLT